MGKKRSTKSETPPLRFDQKLVLNQWMLSLFEVSSFDTLAEDLKSLEIEVTKLRDEMGQKTVAIDAFEGNKLVLVDEGHRGASSSVEGAWMSARNRLYTDQQCLVSDQ